MAKIWSIGVFCGSASGVSPAYAANARKAGDAIARKGARLVYGGGDVGVRPEVVAEATPWHGRPGSLVLDLPPLATVAYALRL